MTAKRGRGKKTSRKSERRFRVRGVRRDPPNMQKLSKALIALAMAEAEREAQAEQTARASGPEDASDARAQAGQTDGGLDE